MSESFKEMPKTAIASSGISRVIPCKKIAYGDIFKWLKLGLNDIARAPGPTIFFGFIFALIPWLITLLVAKTGWHLVILPSMVIFMMIGPFLAAGLYDISWELEKGHKPTIMHSIKALKRNTINELAFGIFLMVIMIFWTRVAALIHALYPPYAGNDLEFMIPFLAVGTVAGLIFTVLVFGLSAFTQPILMERKVDIMTAVLTSLNTVWLNKGPMALWAIIIAATVVLGFATAFVGFILFMPLVGYASWHAYIDAIATKRERQYE